MAKRHVVASLDTIRLKWDLRTRPSSKKTAETPTISTASRIVEVGKNQLKRRRSKGKRRQS